MRASPSTTRAVNRASPVRRSAQRDLAAATQAGVVVTKVPDYCIDEVSDHAMALLLAAARKIPRSSAQVHDGRWDMKAVVPIHRLRGSGMTQILAINFGRTAAEQILEMPNIRQTTAIDLMTGLAEKKPLESSTIRLNLPPLTGKVILFQPKYYD